ncbi:hypothetical protein M426DRAFT_201732 [Hypoxylon sp. CI-4A]|nr:hypothetical protein M426DRAFT_201732 [Hypoxylon sp. CI-4A]
MYSPRAFVSAAATLLALCNVAAASPQGGPISPAPTLPGHCSTTIDDWEHTTATVKTHECYTYTRTVQSAACPTLSCPPRPTDAICPEIIIESRVTVPCATDCCPTTTTTYEPVGACPTCADCPIPTEWITYTTGCVGTPTITHVSIETPPWNTPGALGGGSQ